MLLDKGPLYVPNLAWFKEASMRIMNEAGTVMVSLLSSNIFSLRRIIFKANTKAMFLLIKVFLIFLQNITWPTYLFFI